MEILFIQLSYDIEISSTEMWSWFGHLSLEKHGIINGKCRNPAKGFPPRFISSIYSFQFLSVCGLFFYFCDVKEAFMWPVTHFSFLQTSGTWLWDAACIMNTGRCDKELLSDTK